MSKEHIDRLKRDVNSIQSYRDQARRGGFPVIIGESTTNVEVHDEEALDLMLWFVFGSELCAIADGVGTKEDFSRVMAEIDLR